MDEIIATIAEGAYAEYDEKTREAISETLVFIVSEWRNNPDAFGDNEKDYRNALLEIAEGIAPWRKK